MRATEVSRQLRFRRRATVRLGLLGLACVIALAACSSSGPTPTATSGGSGALPPTPGAGESGTSVAGTPASDHTVTPEGPHLGHFTAVGSMVNHANDAYNPPVPAFLHDGRVLFTGGSASPSCTTCTPGDGIKAAEIFDPATNSFAATTDLPVGRYNHTATTLLDGDVLIAGGEDSAGTLSSAHIYHPATASYGKTYPMTVSRSGHTATLLRDGHVLIAGGQTWEGPTGGGILNSAELYDPNTGTFAATGSMSRGRTGAVATALIDGRVLIVGGAAYTDYVGSPFRAPWAEIYDPATGRFTAVAAAPVGEKLDVTATTLYDGRVLVAGGIAVDGSGCQVTAEIFDPSTGRFTATPHMTNCSSVAALLYGENVLLAGGVASPSGQLYVPATGTFVTIGPLPSGFKADSATPLADGRVLITSRATAEIWAP